MPGRRRAIAALLLAAGAGRSRTTAADQGQPLRRASNRGQPRQRRRRRRGHAFSRSEGRRNKNTGRGLRHYAAAEPGGSTCSRRPSAVATSREWRRRRSGLRHQARRVQKAVDGRELRPTRCAPTRRKSIGRRSAARADARNIGVFFCTVAPRRRRTGAARRASTGHGLGREARRAPRAAPSRRRDSAAGRRAELLSAPRRVPSRRLLSSSVRGSCLPALSVAPLHGASVPDTH